MLNNAALVVLSSLACSLLATRPTPQVVSPKKTEIQSAEKPKSDWLLEVVGISNVDTLTPSILLGHKEPVSPSGENRRWCVVTVKITPPPGESRVNAKDIVLLDEGSLHLQATAYAHNGAAPQGLSKHFFFFDVVGAPPELRIDNIMNHFWNGNVVLQHLTGDILVFHGADTQWIQFAFDVPENATPLYIQLATSAKVALPEAEPTMVLSS